MLLLNKTTKNSAGCAMTFCKEMSSRVEEPFYKNICFLGIDTKYCSDLTCFWFDSIIRSSGRQWCQRNKNTKIQKVAKKTLQKGCLKINEAGEKKTGNQKLLPYKWYPKTLSEITTSYKKVIEWDTTFISWRKLSPYKMI